jgi:hypothetical protein
VSEKILRKDFLLPGRLFSFLTGFCDRKLPV